MFPKTVTDKIVEYWAKGLSASETVKAFREDNVSISLNTVYAHRHSLTAQHLINELLRQQRRDITKAESSNPELAMKYRNELLKILMPQQIEQRVENGNNWQVEIIERQRITESEKELLKP